MKHREFVYTGEPIPTINKKEHTEFLINAERSIFLSLRKRDLLTAAQLEQCIAELEKQSNRMGTDTRQ